MSAGWTANAIWIVAITPAARPSASGPRGRRCRSDSAVKRSARSAPRPIVLPSMIPETDSDSSTSADMSARRRCCSVVIRRRSCRRGGSARRRAARTPARSRPGASRAGTSPRSSRSPWSRSEAIDVAVVVTTLSQAADVVGDPRLHLAGARAREERQRHPLQVLGRRRRAGRASPAGRRRSTGRSATTPSAPVTIAIAIIPATSRVSSVRVVLAEAPCRARRAAGTARPC